MPISVDIVSRLSTKVVGRRATKAMHLGMRLTIAVQVFEYVESAGTRDSHSGGVTCGTVR
jgi:hypothetical protein